MICLPVSSVASSALNSLDDEPETIIFASPRSCIPLANFSQSGTAWISSRKMNGLLSGFTFSWYASRISISSFRFRVRNRSSSKFTIKVAAPFAVINSFAICRTKVDFPVLLMPDMQIIWLVSVISSMSLSRYFALNMPVSISFAQKFQSVSISKSSSFRIWGAFRYLFILFMHVYISFKFNLYKAQK